MPRRCLHRLQHSPRLPSPRRRQRHRPRRQPRPNRRGASGGSSDARRTRAAAKPPAPFPQGAKIAFVNLQAIAALSTDGKAATAKVKALTQKKQTEIADKRRPCRANQQKLQTGGGVMSDTARGQLEKEIERQTRELERLKQDAQAELNELQQELQGEFQKKLLPVLTQLRKRKGFRCCSARRRRPDLGRARSRPDAGGGQEARRREEAGAEAAGR